MTTDTGARTSAETSLYGGVTHRRITTRDLQAATDRGERWSMLTSYDNLTAKVFDDAGIPVLLVGDSAGNNVLGFESTIPVEMDEMLPLVRAVVSATTRALVVADLPFGSYQTGIEDALRNGFRFLKAGGAQAVKLEGGRRVVPQVDALVAAGVPVMGHLGLTPQSLNTIGGYRIQGRGDTADLLVEDALALQEAGAFAVVLELVTADVAARVSEALDIPTVGIGSGAGCDAQVLVWTDMAGLTEGPGPRFVKRYAEIRALLGEAAREFASDVREGTYPAPEHSYS